MHICNKIKRTLNRHVQFQEAEAPRFQDSRHMKVVRLSALALDAFAPRNYSWYSFILETNSIPGTQCCRKDYFKEKFQWHHRESNPRPSDNCARSAPCNKTKVLIISFSPTCFGAYCAILWKTSPPPTWRNTPQWARVSSVSRFHEHTQTHDTLQIHLWTTDNTQRSHALSGVRNHNASKRAVADPRLRSRGHWHRPGIHNVQETVLNGWLR